MAAPRRKIVVIGGGFAGLACADALQDCDVVIFEARDRIGGRVWTTFWEDVPLEVGASWIHGIEGNPIRGLADRCGAKYQKWDKRLAVVKDGKAIGWPRSWDKAAAKIEELKGPSMRDALEAAKVKKVFGRLEDWEAIANSELVLEYGCDLEDLDVTNLLDDEFPGVDAVLEDGYSALAEKLRKGIRVRTIVRKIIDEEHRVVLHVKDANGEVTADLVVVPLGVLAHPGAIDFVPPLPQRKLDAIDGLKTGNLHKVYAEFPKPFWGDTNLDQVLRVGSKSHRFAWFIFLSRVYHTKRPILCAFNGGRMADDLEDLDDDHIIHALMDALHHTFPRVATIPRPTRFRVSRWRHDPFARGAYSYVPAGSDPSWRKVLAEPLDGGRIFFAGEATASDYPSTVHGAFLSGQRAAARLRYTLSVRTM